MCSWRHKRNLCPNESKKVSWVATVFFVCLFFWETLYCVLTLKILPNEKTQYYSLQINSKLNYFLEQDASKASKQLSSELCDLYQRADCHCYRSQQTCLPDEQKHQAVRAGAIGLNILNLSRPQSTVPWCKISWAGQEQRIGKSKGNTIMCICIAVTSDPLISVIVDVLNKSKSNRDSLKRIKRFT